MTTQPELPIRTKKTARDRARYDADMLVDILRKRPALQRRPAADIAQFMMWNDRRLRSAAEASDGLILSAPGCTGYRLAECTPVEDYLRTERARYLSQIQDMQRRLIEMDKAVHHRSPTKSQIPAVV